MNLENISYLSIIFDHDVTVVAITNAQDKGGNTVASTRTCKQVNSCIIPIPTKKETLSSGIPITQKRVFLLQKSKQGQVKKKTKLDGHNYGHNLPLDELLLS